MGASKLDKKIKICLVTISLGGGGAERSTALLSKLLEKKGYEVHLVVLTDKIDYAYKGKLFNLGKFKNRNDNLFQRLRRFRKLKKYLAENQFDYIIDNRPKNNALRELYYLKYIYTSQKLIYVIRNSTLEKYLPIKNKFFSTWVVDLIIKRVYKLVAVSKAIAKEVNKGFSTKKAIGIYNPIENFCVTNNTGFSDEGYILFLGRIEEKSKNLSLLLESYKFSSLAEKGVKLKIVGSGPDEVFVNKKIKALNLEKHVERIAFTPEVQSYIKAAKFLVLTSNYEGFPRVIIEALSLGTPVVSVNCKSGPSEIVQDKINGLLINSYDKEVFGRAINELFENKKLYKTCKENTKQSVAHLEQEVIAEEWAKILV